MSDPDLPDQFTLLQGMAAQQHELYLSWIQAGFTPDSALFLLAAASGAKIVPPNPEVEPPQ